MGTGRPSCECHPVLWLFIRTMSQSGMSVGVIELSPCSGLGSKLLGLLMGLRRSLPLLSSPWEPQIMALREYSENVISRVRAVTVWWEDADVH